MFCYFVEYKYDVPINANNGKVKTASKKEKRYYFKDDKIFLVWLKPTANGAEANRDNLTIGIQKEAKVNGSVIALLQLKQPGIIKIPNHCFSYHQVKP